MSKPSIYDLFPEIGLHNEFKRDPRLEEYRGKTLTKQDAYRLLEKAAQEYVLVDKGVGDPEDVNFYHNLALGVMISAMQHGRETRGRPKRK
jgi:hypothetical protein